MQFYPSYGVGSNFQFPSWGQAAGIFATITPALPACDEGFPEPYNLADGDVLTYVVNAGAPIGATFNAGPAVQDAGAAEPYNVDTLTLILRVGPASEPTQTANLVGVAATAAQVAAQINAQITGVQAIDNAGTLQILTDAEGTAARLEVVGGTALAALTMIANTDLGSGNVADIDAVTAAEVVAVAVAASGGQLTGFVTGGQPHLCTVSVGPSASLEVDPGGANTVIRFQGGLIFGVAGSALVPIRWGKSRGFVTVPPEGGGEE